MTRPKPQLKKIRSRANFSPLQRYLVAKEIASGKPLKNVQVDWRISHAYLHKIFVEHLEWRIVWKPGKEDPPVVEEAAE